MRNETAFTLDTSSIKFGAGVTRELGHDMTRFEARRVLVVTYPHLAGSEAVATACRSLRDARIDAVVFSGARVEPSDRSFQDAIEIAAKGRFDGYVAVGGGSSMDTAKAANLYA